MNLQNSVIWALVAYVLLFFLTIGCIFRWRIKVRRERPPEKFKLLRLPGESLRRRMREFDESLDQWVWGAALAPVLLASTVVLIAAKFFPREANSTLWGAAIVLAAGLVLSGSLLYSRLRRNRDNFLGYLGERAVSEYLAPLLAEGYRIFHDVPAEGRDSDFNLDHVAVGPTGVFVIETKTRRKGRALPGRKDHEVTFDGQRLIWPWGEDLHGIDQAIAEADYLRKWIETRTGFKLTVKPILTLPGWYVHEKPGNGIRVVNSKILPGVIRGHGERALPDEQIDLIARQLDLVCRDVED